MLDPEQNKTFNDHYLDTPFDLSKVLLRQTIGSGCIFVNCAVCWLDTFLQVLFVCTANVVDTIPAPLLDRMEVLRLSGYTMDEKVRIASKFLLPQAREETGVAKVTFSTVIIPHIAFLLQRLVLQEVATLRKPAIVKLIEQFCREAGVRNLQKHVEKIFRKVALQIAERYLLAGCKWCNDGLLTSLEPK